MSQLALDFAVVRLAPPCAFGSPTVWGTVYAPDWSGPHHCPACAAAGTYDAAGYTPKERRKAGKR